MGSRSDSTASMTGYLAADGFETQLEQELARDVIRARHGRLFLTSAPPRPAAWAANIWYDPVEIPFESISQAAAALRAMQRNWALYPQRLHRRASLIQDKLPHVSAKPLQFPAPPPKAPLGSWTLLDANRLLAAARCSSAFANGAVEFVENRSAPPNRAYLKLWEAFTLIDKHPQAGELCLDLGASPGGWTWVLQSLGARVIAIDRAPLDPDIAALPGVEFRSMSAFGLEPREIGPVDWLCSDVVCYPAKLLELVKRWLDAGLARNFICTIKFQGDTDHGAAAQFAAIPGSRVMHLHHNKHELTWICLAT